MILEYTLSCAAVARGFSAYLAVLLGWQPGSFLVRAGPFQLDLPALLLIAALTLLLALGTRETSLFNSGGPAPQSSSLSSSMSSAAPHFHMTQPLGGPPPLPPCLPPLYSAPHDLIVTQNVNPLKSLHQRVART